MEYQKIINFWGDEVTQPSKFRIKSWVEINGNAHGIYNKNRMNLRLQCWS